MIRFLFATFLALLLTACASSHVQRGPGVSGATLPPPDTTNASGAYEGESDYRIGAQDLLEVNVFGVEDLSRTVRVNSNGQVSLPLVGGLSAGGLTIPELEAGIAEAYRNGYLQDPQVTVFVKEYASQRITVEGAVKNPGIYPLTGKTTLLQAVAMAQGLDPLANLAGVVLFRQVDGQRMGAVYDIRDLRAGRIADPQIFGDDLIVVDQSDSKTALRRFIESVPVFGMFMWF